MLLQFPPLKLTYFLGGLQFAPRSNPIFRLYLSFFPFPSLFYSPFFFDKAQLGTTRLAAKY